MEYGKINIEIKLLKQNANDGIHEEEFYDFTKYVQMGVGQSLNLDDTLKTMNITLEGLPFKQKFEPTSMFRVRITQYNVNDDDETTELEYDYALQEDYVEQPNLADDYYTHNLSLIDVGVVAQTRPVDNMSVTYKLQNVLMTTQSVDLDEKVVLNINNANTENSFLPSGNYHFGNNTINPLEHRYFSGYQYEWVDTVLSYPQGTLSESNPATMNWYSDFRNMKNIAKNILYDANNNNTFTFTMPSLLCYYGMPNTRTYGLAGFLPVDLVIGDLNVVTNEYVETPVITSYPSKYAKYYDDVESKLWKHESVNGNHAIDGYSTDAFVHTIVASGTYSDDVIVNGEIKNRQITLSIQPNHQYTFMFTRHKMQTNGYINPLVTSDERSQYNIFTYNTDWRETYTYLEQDYECNMRFRINVYDPNDLLVNLFKEADQTDAYYLFQKSQIVGLPLRKSVGVAYYDTMLPFIVSESDKTLLKQTKLNESDFNGKNLWEIFSEIGKYIHAKPVVSVVTDDDGVMTGQFLVSWLRYGNPEIKYAYGTENTIFHSKFAQDYVSALTSYVTNYFNLGSSITEYLHTSSESDDGLVYNDVVKLKTKYPMLEVLQLVAINSSNVERDITQYLFEYNIYRVLNYSGDMPNKANAIYYHLGTNLIEGMQYVEPQPTGVECAYSMKNILGRAFGMTENQIKAIQINEYCFKITYRTKDSVRITTTRPDIRKYLLNSDIDKYPIHTQFNQQQDKLISSDAFGLNTYGKLIRTGNTTYQITNWIEGLDELAKEGALYRIDNNLYYASKIERVYYSNHIEEKIIYTKDFNKLSQIIGIPSEPRFYEISERNIVNREISFEDYVIVGDEPSGVRLTMLEHNAILDMFRTIDLEKYALTLFKGDGDKTYNTDSNTSLYVNLLPINTYTSKNTYTLEWDCQDNYSCGEKLTDTQNTLNYALNIFSLLNHLKGTDTYAQAYKIRDYVRYVDVFGRADLMDFIILKDLPNIAGVSKRDLINQLPEITETNLSNMSFYNKVYGSSIESVDYDLNTSTNITTINNALNQYKSNYGGFIVAKDNREQLSFNYNIQITTNSDRIVLGNMMWNNSYTDDEFYIVFLNKEINKFSADYVLEENILFKSQALTMSDLLTISHNSNGYLVYLDVEDVSGVDSTSRDNSVAFAIVRKPNVNGNYPIIIGKNYDSGNNNWLLTFGGYNKSRAITNRKQLDDVE